MGGDKVGDGGGWYTIEFGFWVLGFGFLEVSLYPFRGL